MNRNRYKLTQFKFSHIQIMDKYFSNNVVAESVWCDLVYMHTYFSIMEMGFAKIVRNSLLYYFIDYFAYNLSVLIY